MVHLFRSLHTSVQVRSDTMDQHITQGKQQKASHRTRESLRLEKTNRDHPAAAPRGREARPGRRPGSSSPSRWEQRPARPRPEAAASFIAPGARQSPDASRVSAETGTAPPRGKEKEKEKKRGSGGGGGGGEGRI